MAQGELEPEAGERAVKLVACMPVRNEAWVLGLSARVALMWCDELIVWCHACVDGSDQIALQIRDETAVDDARLRLFVDEKPEWDEMRHRQRMLEEARKRGATHIAIVDADEVLCGGLVMDTHHEDGAITKPIRTVVSTISPSSILQLPGYNLRCGLNSYHSNGLWGNRWFSVAFADNPALFWGGDCFHHREPMGPRLKEYRPIEQGQGGIMHLWGASEERLKAKHALYKITEALRFPEKPIRQIDQMYSLWRSERDCYAAGYPGPWWDYRQVPKAWWAPYMHLEQYLDVDAEPWQAAECRRLIEKHGAERFKGLDVFGVA